MLAAAPVLSGPLGVPSKELAHPWGGTFMAMTRREVRAYLDAGERIVVLLRFYAKPTADDTEIALLEVHVWTLDDTIYAIE
jgi:hypothetical protein